MFPTPISAAKTSIRANGTALALPNCSHSKRSVPWDYEYRTATARSEATSLYMSQLLVKSIPNSFSWLTSVGASPAAPTTPGPRR